MAENEPLLENEERLHCSAIYHLVRLRGAGSDYVLPLYDLSIRVGGKSGRFFMRMTELASYLDCDRNQLYNAAKLLVTSGFWVKIEAARGHAVHYRPVAHHSKPLQPTDWVAIHGNDSCCSKALMPWDGEEQDALVPLLYGDTGGMKFYPNNIKGWRDLGLADDVIRERAREAMQQLDSKPHGTSKYAWVASYIRKK